MTCWMNLHITYHDDGTFLLTGNVSAPRDAPPQLWSGTFSDTEGGRNELGETVVNVLEAFQARTTPEKSGTNER